MIKGLIQISNRENQIRECCLASFIVAVHIDALAVIHRRAGVQLPRCAMAHRLPR
jgi:hypothetical protein